MNWIIHIREFSKLNNSYNGVFRLFTHNKFKSCISNGEKSQERAKVESACCLIIASEWSALLSTWRSRLRTVTEREDILEAFSSAVQDVISSRPRTNTLTDVLLNYIRHRPSLNSVSFYVLSRYELVIAPKNFFLRLPHPRVLNLRNQNVLSSITMPICGIWLRCLVNPRGQIPVTLRTWGMHCLHHKTQRRECFHFATEPYDIISSALLHFLECSTSFAFALFICTIYYLFNTPSLILELSW